MKLTLSELIRRAVVLEGKKSSITIAQGKEFTKCLGLVIIEAVKTKEVSIFDVLELMLKYMKRLRSEK